MIYIQFSFKNFYKYEVKIGATVLV